MAADHDLAQVNIMRLRAWLDSPELAAAFVAALDPVNALADQAPGFVWRLKTDEGNSTALRIFEDDTLLVNMSTWRSLETMTDYVYRTAHAAVMRRRREFALPIVEAYVALWWVSEGHRPDDCRGRRAPRGTCARTGRRRSPSESGRRSRRRQQLVMPAQVAFHEAATK